MSFPTSNPIAADTPHPINPSAFGTRLIAEGVWEWFPINSAPVEGVTGSTESEQVVALQESLNTLSNEVISLSNQTQQLESATTVLEELVETIGDPIFRMGSPYVVQALDRHNVVITDGDISVPAFEVGEAPATINVYNMNSDDKTITGTNYTGIDTIEGNGVAVFLITDDGSGPQTEGVGGRA